jgi:hypothetical protein
MRWLALALLAVALPAQAVTTAQHVKRHHRKPKQPSWFSYRAFPPTPDSLIEQNEVIDGLGLPRIKDGKALKTLEADAELVPITENMYVRISPKLETDRRYAKPWVNAFLQELGAEYFAAFAEPIQVNSAVRTLKTQARLIRWNKNAAPVHGEKASAHLAGVAVDLQRRGLTQAQVQFIQQKLLTLAGLHMVIVEEELREPCFHIVVTGNYLTTPALDQKLPAVVNFKEVDHDISNALDCPKHTP